MNILEWLFWNVPDMNLFIGHANVVGVFWFFLLFTISFKRYFWLLRNNRFLIKIVLSLSLAVSLTLLVHYLLDELDVVIRWILIGFDYNLFLHKYNVYFSIPIALFTVYIFGKKEIKIKNTTFLTLFMIIIWDIVFAKLNIEFRFESGFLKAFYFWTIYPLAKFLWFLFFLTLWVKHEDIMEEYRKVHGTGETYMIMALERIKLKDGEVLIKATNPDNIGKYFGFLDKIKEIKHGDFRDDYHNLKELVEVTEKKGYRILRKGYFDNPPWFDLPARKKPFPIPIWVLRIMVKILEPFSNKYTSHHTYVVTER